jgi:hypothetical protein
MPQSGCMWRAFATLLQKKLENIIGPSVFHFLTWNLSFAHGAVT